MSRFFFARTVKLGKIFGIQIEIDYSWFIIFALVFAALAFQFFPIVFNFSTLVSVILGLVTTLLFFTSVLIHELAHSIIANRNGVTIKKIILFIFGGMASLTSEPKKPGVEFRIALAGPMTSLVLAALFLGLAWLVQFVYFPLAAALEYLALINFVLAIFNLVPGYPLDGGRLLRAALWKKFGDIIRATRIAANAGVVVGYLLVLFGVFELLAFGSLFGLLWFGFIGFFLISAARESVLQTVLSQALAKVKVHDLMSKEALTAPANSQLVSVVDDIFLERKKESVLVTKLNKVTGLLSLEMVRRLPAQKVQGLKVEQVMHQLDRQEFLSPNMPALRALEAMSLHNHERLPVVDKQRLVGEVTRDDIRVYLSVKTDVLNKTKSVAEKV